MTRITRILSIAFALVTAATAASAQSWPTKPVRFIVPAPAGTAPDIIARLVADKLVPMWGQQVLVDPRAGAGGINAMSNLVRSAPDGYTFAIAQATVLTLTPHLFKDPQFNVDKDLVPVVTVGTGPMMIAVNPATGVNNLADFIKLAKSKPGAVNFAPPLLNSVPHLAGELLSGSAGIKLFPVPYNGSTAAITATLANESQVTIDGLPPLVGHVKAGTLKPIAVTSLKRVPGYESIPTVAETFPGFEAIGWFVVVAPAGTPQAVIDRVNKDVNTVIQMPEVVAKFADLGVFSTAGNQQAAIQFVQKERDKWSKVVRDVGIKAQ